MSSNIMKMVNILKPPCDEGVIRSRPSRHPCTKYIGMWILAATILGSSMAFIDGTAVNVALPIFQKELHATVIQVQWIVEIYALLLSILLLVGGSMGDLYGRPRIFVIGIGIFAVGSGWCGLAPDVNHLIIARAVQGIGGALLALLSALSAALMISMKTKD